MEREGIQQTSEQLVEKRFGKETLEAAEEYGREITEEIKSALVGMSLEEGSTREQDEDAKKYIRMWRDFVDGLTARTSSVNEAPEIVVTAIEGATALFSVERTRQGREAAERLRELLKIKFGI